MENKMRKKLSFRSKLLFLAVFSFLSWTTAQENDFVFQRGKQKVVLELENKIKHLTWGETRYIRISPTNIAPQDLSMFGKGLKLVRGATAENSESIWVVTPDKMNLKSDTLKLTVRAKDLKGESWTHEFKVLIK